MKPAQMTQNEVLEKLLLTDKPPVTLDSYWLGRLKKYINDKNEEIAKLNDELASYKPSWIDAPKEEDIMNTTLTEITTDALYLPLAGHCSKSVLRITGNGKAEAAQVDITHDEYTALLLEKTVTFRDGDYVKFEIDDEWLEWLDLQQTYDDFLAGTGRK